MGIGSSAQHHAQHAAPDPAGRRTCRRRWRSFVIVLAGIFAEYQNRRVHEQSLRADVLDQRQPDPRQARRQHQRQHPAGARPDRDAVDRAGDEPGRASRDWPATCSPRRSQLSNIAGAPDLVVSLIYPLEGNERAIGLDYRKNEAQREAALRARDSGELVLRRPGRSGPGRAGLHRPLPGLHRRRRRRQDLLGHRLGGRSMSKGSIATAAFSTRTCRSRSPSPAATAWASRARSSSAARQRGAGQSGDGRRHPALGLVADRRDPQRRLGRDAAQRLDAPAAHPGGRRADHGADRHDRTADRRAAEEHRRAAAPRGAAGAAVAAPRAGARQLADRRLGAEHRDRRPGLGRPHQRTLRLSRRRRPPRLHALGALDPSGRPGPRRWRNFRQAVATGDALPDGIPPAAAGRRGPARPRERQGLPGPGRAGARSSASTGT